MAVKATAEGIDFDTSMGVSSTLISMGIYLTTKDKQSGSDRGVNTFTLFPFYAGRPGPIVER